MRVVRPLFVVRVGYPKCVADYLPVVRERFAEQLRVLRVGITARMELGEGFEFREDGPARLVMERVERELAYALLKRDNFGGSERCVHEVEHARHLGAETRVTELRTAYTGTYSPGGGTSTWGGGFDDSVWPPDLEDRKAHRIARVLLEEPGAETPAGLPRSRVEQARFLEIRVSNLEKLGE